MTSVLIGPAVATPTTTTTPPHPSSPQGKYSNYLLVLLGGLCWAVILVFIAVPILLLFLSKCFVLLLAQVFRKDLHSVSTGDAAFTIGCTWDKSKLSFGLLLHVQGHLKLEQVQDRFYTSLLEPKVGNKYKYEKLYCCLVTFCGYVFRKTLSPETIDLNQIIYEKWLKEGETLESVVDEWMARNYREMAPAWEVMVIPILTHGHDGQSVMVLETVVALKIHHVFADGYSLLHILDMLTGSKAPYLVKESTDSFWKQITDAIKMPVTLPHFLSGPGSPRTNPLRLKRPQKQWTYTFTTVDLAPIKAIRRKYEVHFASIILSLIVGSIRRYLLERRSENCLPSHLSMANTLPCPLHPSQGHQLCNHWTLEILKSPIGVDNPLQRVIETEKSFNQFHEAGFQRAVVNFLFPFAWLCPKFMSEKLMEEDRLGYNCGLTSLIGAEKYEFLGSRVTTIKPLLTLVDSHPFTVFSWFTFSHSNKVDITLAAAPDLFPCRASLARMSSEYFQSEYRNLCAQCGIAL